MPDKLPLIVNHTIHMSQLDMAKKPELVELIEMAEAVRTPISIPGQEGKWLLVHYDRTHYGSKCTSICAVFNQVETEDDNAKDSKKAKAKESQRSMV